MPRENINRGAELADVTGRTLEGTAFRYDRASRVTDDNWRTSYLEEFVNGCTKKTLKEHTTWPLLRMHTDTQIGDVQFMHSDETEALMFRAVLSLNRDADEVLSELDDWRDVSVGATAYVTKKRQGPQGTVVQRAEIGLRELSLVPTGLGLVKSAGVDVVRAAVHGTPRLDQVRRRRLFLL